MKNFAKIAALSLAPFALIACDSTAENVAEEQGNAVQDAAEGQADALEDQADAVRVADPGMNSAGTEAQADALEDRADAVRDQADATAANMEENAEEMKK